MKPYVFCSIRSRMPISQIFSFVSLYYYNREVPLNTSIYCITGVNYNISALMNVLKYFEVRFQELGIFSYMMRYLN